MRVRVQATATAVGVLLGLQIAAAGAASADENPILVADTGNVTLTAKDGGGATAAVTIENQAEGPIDVWAEVGSVADKDCTITSPAEGKAAEVDGHRQQKVTIAFAEACDPDRKVGTDFIVHAGSATFDLHADPPKTPNPNWIAVLVIYGVAAVVSALVLAYAWGSWTKPVTRPTKDFTMALPALDANWKFSDSWAANATVVTAVFTGVFGAKEVTNALLGEDSATNLLAVALVSAALALGLVGVSPMVLQGFRKRIDDAEDAVQPPAPRPAVKAIPAGLYVTPRALVFAAFFTLTGTVGQLSSLLFALMLTDFGSDILIGILGVIAAVIIFWYAIKATEQNLTTGAAPPVADPPTGGETITITLPAPGGRRDLHVEGEGDEDQVAEEQRMVTVSVPAGSSSTESRPSGII